MKSTIRHYLSVYRHFINTRVAEATSFRVHFVLVMLLDIIFYMTSLGSIDFIYGNVETIGPWKREELMFFVAYMLTLDHLQMTFVSESFWRMADDIKTGALDFSLMRPVHSIFIVFFRYFRPSSFLNFFIIWPITYYFALQVPLEPLALVLLPLFSVLSFILLIHIEMIISTSMFWLTEGLGINFFRMQIQEVSRWPDFIYLGLSKVFFTIGIPVLLIGSPSVRFLLDLESYVLLLYQFGAIIILHFILRFVWNRGLANYDSASS